MQFPDVSFRENFLIQLSSFFKKFEINLEKTYLTEATLLGRVKDKDERQKMLDLFFRAISQRVSIVLAEILYKEYSPLFNIHVQQ